MTFRVTDITMNMPQIGKYVGVFIDEQTDHQFKLPLSEAQARMMYVGLQVELSFRVSLDDWIPPSENVEDFYVEQVEDTLRKERDEWELTHETEEN